MTGEFAHLNPPPHGEQTRAAILDFILAHLEEKGWPPTVREIGEAVGLSSPASVHRWLDLLVAEGRLVRDDTKPRAIRVVA